jgi:DNA-binding IclR family transcriptional regulator
MCVDQHELARCRFAVSYERGRPMPLSRGSASKAILAHLPTRVLRRYYDADKAAIAKAGLGSSWKVFQGALRKLRKSVVAVSRGEVDRGFVGISGPVFGPDDEILGSIGLVIRAQLLVKSPHLLAELIGKVREASDDVTAVLQSNGGDAARSVNGGMPARKTFPKPGKRARKPVKARRRAGHRARRK